MAHFQTLTRRDIGVVAGCAAAAIMLWLSFGLRSAGVLGAPIGDVPAVFYFWRGFLIRTLSEGALPWWNPHTFLGAPFIASFQTAVFYPLTWLMLPMPTVWALNASTVLHLWLGGLGAGLLARARGATLVAAGFAAVTVAISGPALARVAAGHTTMLAVVAWFPWFLWAVEAVLRSPSRRGLAGVAALVLLATTAGHPQVLFYFLLLGGFWALLVAWEAGLSTRQAVTRLGLLTGMVMLGLLASAVQLLPTIMALPSASRQRLTPEQAGGFSLPLFHLAGFVMPNRFGDAITTPYRGAWYAWEMVIYVGIPAMVCAAIAALRPLRRAFIAAAAPLVVVLLIGLGNSTPLHDLIARLPIFGMFRGPAKIFLMSPVFIALLAAQGLDLARLSVRGRSMALGIGAACLLSAILCFLFGSLAADEVPKLLRARAAALDNLEVTFPRYADPRFATAFAIMASGATMTAAINFLVVGAAMIFAALCRERRAVFASLALVALQGWALSSEMYWTASTSRPAILAEKLRSMDLPQNGRIFFRDRRATANTILALGGYAADGYDPIYPKRYGELVNALNGGKRELFLSAPKAQDLARAGATMGATAVWDGEALRELKGGSARATIHARVESVASEEAMWERVARGAQAVVLTPTPLAELAESSTTLVLSAETPNELAITLDPPAIGVLILADSYHPGWTATADGRAVGILPANVASRAVVLSVPTREVRMRYIPPGALLGAILSALGVFGIILIAIKKA